jgi:hypothetical protein
MLYLFVVETANVALEFGIIYQPLIVEFGRSDGVLGIAPAVLMDYLNLGTKAATTISPRRELILLASHHLFILLPLPKCFPEVSSLSRPRQFIHVCDADSILIVRPSPSRITGHRNFVPHM